MSAQLWPPPALHRTCEDRPPIQRAASLDRAAASASHGQRDLHNPLLHTSSPRSPLLGGRLLGSDCSLKVKKGSITGIIGPNGSGKTTLFNLIAGNLKSSSGSVTFDQENITDVPSYELFSKGLLRTFQIAHEFSNLSVLENLMMVPGNQSGEKLMTALLKPKLVAEEEAIVKEKAKEVVDFLNLGHLTNEFAGNLSGGQKKLLELGRTMMVDAKLVLLDSCHHLDVFV